MGLIRLIEHLAQALTGGTASKVAADEVKAWSPWLAARLTKFAVKRLPEADRERYAEEWDSHVADTPGSVGKICVACGFIFAANKIRRATALPLDIQLEHALFRVLASLNLKVFPPIRKGIKARLVGGSRTAWYSVMLLKLCLRITELQLRWSLSLNRRGGLRRREL